MAAILIIIYLIFLVFYGIYGYIAVYHLKKDHSQIDFLVDNVISWYKKTSIIVILATIAVVIFELLA